MNIMIYINKTNEQRFQDEANKSGLINDLLHIHYNPLTILTEAKLEESMKEIKKLVDVPGTGVTSKPPIPKHCQHGSAIGFCKFGCKK